MLWVLVHTFCSARKAGTHVPLHTPPRGMDPEAPALAAHCCGDEAPGSCGRAGRPLSASPLSCPYWPFARQRTGLGGNADARRHRHWTGFSTVLPRLQPHGSTHPRYQDTKQEEKKGKKTKEEGEKCVKSQSGVRRAPCRILRAPARHRNRLPRGITPPVTGLWLPTGAPRSFGSLEFPGFLRGCSSAAIQRDQKQALGKKKGFSEAGEDGCLAWPHRVRELTSSGSQIRRAAYESSASQRPQRLVEISRMSWTRMTYWK